MNLSTIILKFLSLIILITLYYPSIALLRFFAKILRKPLIKYILLRIPENFILSDSQFQIYRVVDAITTHLKNNYYILYIKNV